MKQAIDKKAIVADWKTGRFTQRELAEKHRCSNGTVAKYTKGINKTNEQLVTSLVDNRQALRRVSESEMSSINQAVELEDKRRIEAERLGLRLDTTIDKAITVADKILGSSEATMQDVMQFSKAQNDFRVGLNIQEKFNSPSLKINNENIQTITSRDFNSFYDEK